MTSRFCTEINGPCEPTADGSELHRFALVPFHNTPLHHGLSLPDRHLPLIVDWAIRHREHIVAVDLNLGGWGTTAVDNGSNSVQIPDRNVFIYNNIVYNPAGFQSQWQHFAIYDSRTNPAGTKASPSSNLSGT